MFHHAMKSQERVTLTVALLAAAALLSACGRNSPNSPPSTAGAPGPASPASAPHDSASARQTAAVAKTPTISAPDSASPTSPPQGSAVAAAQAATPATTPAFKEVTPRQILVTLAPTAKPNIRTYPGVKADIDGIRIGMTVSQATTIAAKYYSRPYVIRRPLSVNYGGIPVQSQSFVSLVAYPASTSDNITLYFTNPAAGNVVYAIRRHVQWDDVSKEPLMVATTSSFITKYGPPSGRYRNWYVWHFGEQSLKPCANARCDNVWPIDDDNTFQSALVNGVTTQIYANLTASELTAPNAQTKVYSADWGIEDYKLRSESMDAATKQLKIAAEAEQKRLGKNVIPYLALTGTYVLTSDTIPAMQELKQNADNILHVTGAVTGPALVMECISSDSVNKSIHAQTFSSSYNGIPNELIKEYGPVTYGSNKYNIVIEASGNPPSTTNVHMSLKSPEYSGLDIESGYTLDGGSIAVAVVGNALAFTFYNTVLKLDRGPNPPKGATVTINGKAYCNSGFAPLPQDLIDRIPGDSMDFVSDNTVNIRAPGLGSLKETYKIDGHQLFIPADNENAPFTIDSDGCLDGAPGGPPNVKFCKK